MTKKTMFVCRSSLLLFLLVSQLVVVRVVRGFQIPSKQWSRQSLIQAKKEAEGASSLCQQHQVHEDDDGRSLYHCSSRRDMLAQITGAAIATTTAMLTGNASPANAVGLVQFPCKEGSLRNNYHFMRAGQSELESNNLWGTNPMFLTNRVDNSLSQMGKEQVSEACDAIRQNTPNLHISQVKFPLAANAMDTAKEVKEELLIPGNLVVPEYTYLDQRGIGSWDMFPLDRTQDAIWALDAMESGKEGRDGLPPPNYDGTPNETLYNQVTRLRQLISITETYNSGDTILFVFPDGTGPALLSCLIAGIPLNRVHELHFAPGEVRTDITYDSVRSSLPTQPTKEYMEAIQRGKIELERLRNMDNSGGAVAPNTTSETVVAQKVSRTASRKQQTAEEQIAKRQQQYEAAAALRAKEHEESKNNKNREKQQRDQQRIEIATQNQQKMEKANPALPSLLSLGLAAALTTFRPPPQSKEEKLDDDSSERITGIAQQKQTTSEDIDSIDASTTRDRVEEISEDMVVVGPSSSSDSISSTKYPELKVLEDLAEAASFDIPEYGMRNSQKQNNASPIRRRDEKQLILEAEKAMDDYLNQDDGAQDYDSWMSQLLLEDDEG